MKFIETSIPGAYLVEMEPLADERGFFARSWCSDEFARHGLNANLAQCNISYNKKRGTLRGMHYQAEPFPEAKLVRCIRGKIYDVILDLRRDFIRPGVRRARCGFDLGKGLRDVRQRHHLAADLGI